MLRLHFDDSGLDDSGLDDSGLDAGGRGEYRADALTCATARTRVGVFRVVAEPDAVVRVEFAHCADPLPAAATADGPAAEAARWIRDHFDGRGGTVVGTDVAEPDLDVRYRGASSFERAVWSATASVPSGTTRTYGEIAAVIGRPGAARAVGGACGRNPVPLLVPCHRIVGSHGIGGYAGGVDVKRRLLDAERRDG